MNTAAKQNKPTDYKHIAVWGRHLCSYPYYIMSQQEAACATGAPLNAVYEEHAKDGSGPTGKWVTIDECAEGTRNAINAEVERISGAK